MKPKIRNRKISNLFYSGQLTVPGPGVPPAIISGKIAAGLLQKELKFITNEATV
jgi:phytoene desaturase